MSRAGAALAGVGRRVAPVLLAFLIAFVFFGATGYDVGEVARGLYDGSIGSTSSLQATFRWSVPLMLIGFGVVVSFRAGEFNIGGQGQFIVGGIAAVWVALEWSLPPVVGIVVGTLAAVIAGSAWSLIAGLLKVYFSADEVITTLMLNLIAVQLAIWVATGPLADPTTSGDAASTPRISDELRISDGTGTSIELFVVLALAALAMWLFLERTPTGMRIGYVGANRTASRWQGISVHRISLLSYALAGALAGLAGAIEVFGPAGRVATGSSPTVGFTAVVVATVGALRIGGTIVAGILFGGLQAAVLFLPIVSDVPISGVAIIEGLVALLITARLFTHFKRRSRRRDRQRATEEAAV
ncbi:MAG: ABC transporter permease [Actinomycetota bacterium]